MPNHIKNLLEIHGTEEQVKEVFERFSTYHEPVAMTTYMGEETYINDNGSYGWHTVETNTFRQRDMPNLDGIPRGFKRSYEAEYTRFPDFDKIIHRPKDLDITSDDFLMGLENSLCTNHKFKETLNDVRKFVNDKDNHLNEKGRKDTVDNFLKGVSNYIKYGYATWSSWSREFWGTKWNAYTFDTLSYNTFTFETAWNGVPDLMHMIAKEFPNLEFTYKYSDEDTGYNCGIYKFKGDKKEEIIIKNESKEAYEIAFELRPEYADDYVLVGDKYEYKEE